MPSLHEAAIAVYQALPGSLRAAVKPAREFYLRQLDRRQMRDVIMPAAKTIGKHAQDHRGQKVFVDCGFHQGVALEAFIQNLPSFSFYGFEINQQDFGARASELKRLYPEISLEFRAVSTFDGVTKFERIGEPGGSHIMEGSSIMKGMHEGRTPYRETVGPIPCVDFSNWLKNVFAMHVGARDLAPYVAVKMDIEGAEFPVLQKMIDDGTIDLVNDLYVEFHPAHFPADERDARYQERERILREIAGRNTLVHEWI